MKGRRGGVRRWKHNTKQCCHSLIAKLICCSYTTNVLTLKNGITLSMLFIFTNIWLNCLTIFFLPLSQLGIYSFDHVNEDISLLYYRTIGKNLFKIMLILVANITTNTTVRSVTSVTTVPTNAIKSSFIIWKGVLSVAC